MGKANSVPAWVLEDRDLLDHGGLHVFRRELEYMPKFTESEYLEERELPKVLVKLVKNIELKLDTVGLYRINGVAIDIENIR